MPKINSRICLAVLVGWVMIGALATGCGDAGATITRLTVGTPGADPYAPMSGTDQVRLTASTQAGGTTAGDSPGLYGGTRRTASCDPAALVEFLKANPDKARAWAAVHGIQPGGIAAFVERLTPVLLRTDTLVTNHGYRNGKAVASPAVLQTGMGVLVNEYGFPAVKCNCGNPLTQPEKKISTGNAKYTGQSWPHFSKRKVTKIKPREPAKGAVTVFVLVDPEAKVGFERPRATTGTLDGPAEALPATEPTQVPESGDPSSGVPGTDMPTPTDSGTPTDSSTPGTETPADGTGVPTDQPTSEPEAPVTPSTQQSETEPTGEISSVPDQSAGPVPS
ncbi:DUF6777 domain-containing protein [Spirillospora sp. NPDC048911]|uniref:DUF6777 domain-containing protein n=1 Tax=Spirillospora sp. NPDC048911 TaxID=3364527 RepID=UPI0037151CBD